MAQRLFAMASNQAALPQFIFQQAKIPDQRPRSEPHIIGPSGKACCPRSQCAGHSIWRRPARPAPVIHAGPDQAASRRAAPPSSSNTISQPRRPRAAILKWLCAGRLPRPAAEIPADRQRYRRPSTSAVSLYLSACPAAFHSRSFQPPPAACIQEKPIAPGRQFQHLYACLCRLHGRPAACAGCDFCEYFRARHSGIH